MLFFDAYSLLWFSPSDLIIISWITAWQKVDIQHVSENLIYCKHLHIICTDLFYMSPYFSVVEAGKRLIENLWICSSVPFPSEDSLNSIRKCRVYTWVFTVCRCSCVLLWKLLPVPRIWLDKQSCWIFEMLCFHIFSMDVVDGLTSPQACLIKLCCHKHVMLSPMVNLLTLRFRVYSVKVMSSVSFKRVSSHLYSLVYLSCAVCRLELVFSQFHFTISFHQSKGNHY